MCACVCVCERESVCVRVSVCDRGGWRERGRVRGWWRDGTDGFEAHALEELDFPLSLTHTHIHTLSRSHIPSLSHTPSLLHAHPLSLSHTPSLSHTLSLSHTHQFEAHSLDEARLEKLDHVRHHHRLPHLRTKISLA